MNRLLPLALILCAASASAQINLNVKGLTPDQQSALASMIGPLAQASQEVQACLNTELGSTAMQRMEDMGKGMNREIVPLCKAGMRAEAREVAVRYAESDEGRAAFKCGTPHKALLADPNAARLLGAYMPIARAVAEGRVPDDVCAGVKTRKIAAPAPAQAPTVRDPRKPHQPDVKVPSR